MASDAEKIAMLSANQRAAAQSQVAAARAGAQRLGSFAGAAGGILPDYSAAPGMQNPELANTSSILRTNLVSNALGQRNALQRLIALRKSRGYQGELSGGGVGTLGGLTAVYTPSPTGATIPVSVA
jgi:hypothetical protein